MKTKLILALISLVVSLNTFSQWGIRGSINTGYGGTVGGGGFKAKPGGYLDATYDVRIYKNFYLQPGVGFFLNNTDGMYSSD